ncbi:MFS transporter [Microbacterium paludicola]|uniref:MFS transporter n=1 Tax=Microbacterium paludicola TaxID=300019 RepID=A0A4Y9FVX8_9MICO|nr:MFS transporter [Microbacterium paludicola]MBF0815837.1 MFS transporter [Microbacterium paludicola]TFU33479.1 MFS transporter [Microbacterium paludicola]
MTSTTSLSRPAPPDIRQRLATAVLLTANFTLAVDFSILNVALPRIGAEVGFATEHLQWIITSFALCAAGFTLFFGRVADLFGRKRLFLAGIALLGASSLAGGLAQEPALLIAARIAQGIATAMVTPAALSLLTTTFAEGPQRSRVLGLNGALMAAGFTAGAVLGGVLAGTVSWRWAFFVNVIVAILVLVIAPTAVRERRSDERPRLDVAGAILVTLALVALVFGISNAGESGWADPSTWLPLAGAAILVVVFGVVESRAREPLVPLELLRRRNVAWGNIAGLIAFATETSLVFLLTLYLQEILGHSALDAGLTLGVLGVGTVIGGLIAPRVIARIGSRGAIVLGLLVQAAVTAPLALLGTAAGSLPALLSLTFVGGIANLVAIVGYVVTATGSLPADRQGLATGLVTLSQQVGIALGTPVMAALVASRLAEGLLPALQYAIAGSAVIAGVAGAVLAVAHRQPAGAVGHG